MPTCVIRGCKNRPEINKDSGITYHRFPINKPELMKKWLQSIGSHALKEKVKIIHNTTTICSQHFEKCYMKTDKQRTRLDRNAVPTLFNIKPSDDAKKSRCWVLADTGDVQDDNAPVNVQAAEVQDVTEVVDPLSIEPEPSLEEANMITVPQHENTKFPVQKRSQKSWFNTERKSVKKKPIQDKRQEEPSPLGDDDDEMSLLCLSPSALTQQVVIVPEVPENFSEESKALPVPSPIPLKRKRELKIPRFSLESMKMEQQEVPQPDILPGNNKAGVLEKVVILRAKSKQHSVTEKKQRPLCPRNIPAEVIKHKKNDCKNNIAAMSAKKKTFYTISEKRKPLVTNSPDDVMCVGDVFLDTRAMLESYDADTARASSQSVSQLCRLCATGAPPMFAIFSLEGRQQKIADKIHHYLPIQVAEDDRLPLQVCCLCLSRLNVCEEFAASSREADLKLRLLLDTEDLHIEVEEMLVDHTQNEDLAETQPAVEQVEKLEPTVTPLLTCADCGKKFNKFKRYARHCYTIHKRKKCKKCDQFFINREDLIQHKLQEHGIKCDCCEASFVSINSLLSHLRKEHPEYKACMCDICGKSFTSKYGLSIHKESHQLDRPFLCDTCGKNFKTKRKLKVHKCVSNSIEALPLDNTCSLCGKIYTLRSSLKRHMIRHQGERRYQCHICQKKFFGSVYLRNHMVIHEKTTLYECQMCCARYFHKRNMISHLKDKHSIPWTYKCPCCDQIFPTIDDVNLHRKVHEMENLALGISQASDVPQGSSIDFQCKICDKYFENIYVLTYHFEDHVIRNQEELNIKSIGEDGTFECNYCGEKMITNWAMKRHFRKFHAENNMQPQLMYECACCAKMFRFKIQLRQHMWLHTGEKPYRCRHCDAGFRTQLAVRVHTRIHTGETPYHCQKCPKKFRSTATLKAHQGTHDKPFTCLHCGQRFPKRLTYKKHLLLHTTDGLQLGDNNAKSKKTTMYKCKHCDFVFKTKAAVKKHELIHVEPTYFSL